MNLYKYRHILIQMVIREIKGRFVGSMGGILWHFVHPILLMLVLLFVFVHIFKLRVGTGGAGASALYIMAGLFPWIIISEGLSRGTSSLIENATIIQKTYFPTEILPAKAVLAPLFNYGIALMLLTAYVIIFEGNATWVMMLLPIVILLQLIFTFGIVLFTSTISVFFRDVLQIMSVIISFWMYLTPILYPVMMLPEWARTAMYLNPLYPITTLYQSIYLGAATLDSEFLAIALCWSMIFIFIGSFFFYKLKYEFADWL